jgi:hypothetical protein
MYDIYGLKRKTETKVGISAAFSQPRKMFVVFGLGKCQHLGTKDKL